MTIPVKRLSLTDAVGAGVALLIVGGGYLLLLQKPLEESTRLSLVREASNRSAQELSAVQAEVERLRHDIDANAKKLASIGGGLPEAREIDRYLARAMATATASGITIDTLSPMPASEEGDHGEVRVAFVGRGSFVAFHRMLGAIERELEYADVTHFSVTSSGTGSESECRLNWSLRICTSRDASTARAVANAQSP